MPQVQTHLGLILEGEYGFVATCQGCARVLDAAISGDGFLVELTQTESQKHNVEEEQSRHRRDHGQVRELGHQSSAQALAGVHQGVDQNDFLHDGKIV